MVPVVRVRRFEQFSVVRNEDYAKLTMALSCIIVQSCLRALTETEYSFSIYVLYTYVIAQKKSTRVPTFVCF